MRKILLLLYLLLLELFIISCGNNFNPRYYYLNKSHHNNDTGESGNTSDLDGDENIDPSTDPFNPNNGDWNRIDYIFDGNKIKDWFLKISFGAGNVPSYQFFTATDGRVWINGDSIKNEKYFDGSKDGNKVTSPMNIDINPLKVFRYDYKNPLAEPDSEYNKSTRMQRFLFIKIEGKAMIDLNQYLIAIDTYSKFIFAYAKITKTDSAPVVGTPYPTGFEAIENYEERRKFYEYDPIGFVNENGDVTLYQEYKDEMAAGATKYVPSVHKNNGQIREMAKHNLSSPGRSPYLNLSSENNRASIIVESKSVKNISIKSYSNPYGLGGYKIKDEAYLVYALRAAIYEGNSNINYVMLGNYGEGKELGVGAVANSITTIKNNAFEYCAKNTKYPISDIENSNINISLDSQFIKYNWLLGFPDYGGTVTKLTTYDNNKLTLNYSGKMIKIVNKTDNIISCTPDSFIMEKGKSQDIVIRYHNNNDNRDEEWEVTYNIRIE